MARATAQTELARHKGRLAAANTAVGELEAKQRLASQTLAAAREALTESERRGSPPAERTHCEQELEAAKAAAAEPWDERVEGAKRRVRDADRALRAFTTEHLAELVTEREESCRVEAESVDLTAQAFLVAVGRLSVAERELTSLVALTRRMTPGDISRTRSTEAARAVEAFLLAGGERPPTLQTPIRAAEQPTPATRPELVDEPAAAA